MLVRHFGAAKWSKTLSEFAQQTVRDWERDNARRKCNTSEKILKISSFSLFSEFYDKSGEFDKNRESGRQHIKSGDSRSNRKGWNLWKLVMFLSVLLNYIDKFDDPEAVSFPEGISGTLTALLSIRGETQKRNDKIFEMCRPTWRVQPGCYFVKVKSIDEPLGLNKAIFLTLSVSWLLIT